MQRIPGDARHPASTHVQNAPSSRPQKNGKSLRMPPKKQRTAVLLRKKPAVAAKYRMARRHATERAPIYYREKESLVLPFARFHRP